MVAMFQTRSPSRTNIEEANKHLQMLFNKVHELEESVKSHADEILKKDEEYSKRLMELTRKKDAEIMELRHRLEISEIQLQKVKQQNEEKDDVISKLTEKSKWVDGFLEYQPVLQKLLASMDAMHKNSALHGSGRSSHPRSRSHKKPVNEGNGVQYSNSTPSIQYMPKSFNSVRHFSISEDEDVAGDPGPDIVIRKMRRDKELYL